MTPAQLSEALRAALVHAVDDGTFALDPAAIPAYAASRLIMGAGLDEIIRVGHRNRQEVRLVAIQAVLERQ